MEWIVLLLIGLVAGTLGSVMGLGGGIVIVPALLLFAYYLPILNHMTPQVAVGTSLLIMIFTGLSSTFAYMKQKKIDFKSGAIFFTGSAPGALFGVWLNKGINVDAFFLYFGLFILFVSFILFIRNHIKPLPGRLSGVERSHIDQEGHHYTYRFHPFIAIIIAFCVGMVSGLFGVGGGSLMVPAMIVLFGFPPHIAVATSMFMILLSSIVGSISHIALGNVDWFLATALIPGAWFGGQLGAAINRRLSSDTLVMVFRIFLIVMAIRLIFNGSF
ncbi:sulfite exporter TauE/SafE family protein [Halalkalibacter urbisdiaboli]|uniref:sulfite exporter TauE/SafE family protein n=1 Tax=Halalkalibacter urbisdiaboli TaxID=1960589 RepID=UPI000B441A02|nr:sulfite exporter TauE/SafE family protein [Halalkalibacter urbisdiaboli]